jgi:acetyltransferase
MAEEGYYARIPREIAEAVPIYRFPEDAVKVAEHTNRYRLWRARPAGEVRKFSVDSRRARSIVEGKHGAGGGYLSPADVQSLLLAYGFPLVRQALVALDGDVVAAARALAFPLVLKVFGAGIVHKSDVGGVALGIGDPQALADARRSMEASLRRAGVWGSAEAFLLQEMANSEGGKEVILGVAHDPKFGPLLMFGMGGRYVEILRDVAFRVLPVTDVDAREMVRSIRSFPLLEGVRGDARVDIEFLEEAVLRLAQLIGDVPGIEELDLNPVVVMPERSACRVVDARIRVS